MNTTVLLRLMGLPGVVKAGIGGAGIAGSGALGWIASSKETQFQPIGMNVVLKTSDAQWRFLYLLADKVFDYLKKQTDNLVELGIIGDIDLKTWLESKFMKTTYETGWEGFRDLCSQVIREDDIPSFMVNIIESRLCIMGEAGSWVNVEGYLELLLNVAATKGNLKHWTTDKKGKNKSVYSKLSAFTDWAKSNYDLWTGFKEGKGKDVIHDTDNEKWETKFKEWFIDKETKVKDEKNNTKTIKDALNTSTKPKKK